MVSLDNICDSQTSLLAMLIGYVCILIPGETPLSVISHIFLSIASDCEGNICQQVLSFFGEKWRLDMDADTSYYYLQHQQ